ADVVTRQAAAAFLHRLAHHIDLVPQLELDGDLPVGSVGVPYTAALAAAGGTAPYSWTAVGLPEGLSLDAASGQITGTPTTAGTADVAVTVLDAHGYGTTTPVAVTIQTP